MATPESPLAPQSGGAVAGPAGTPGAAVLAREFVAETITELRHELRRHAESAGLSGDALDDFVTAVNELVTNAVRHGGGAGSLCLTVDGDTVIADVTDRGEGFAGRLPVAAGPPASDMPGGRGILLARKLTDTLMISDGPEGATVTVTRCLTPRPE